ncbi:MAG TPA: phosphoribosylpyrophosphate synthetase [Methylomirabilota bacterium]|nr:phosphoribosylpyrophosphate synthetase [Methylomirabilota bacterium]
MPPEKNALTDVAAVVDDLTHHGFPEEFRVVAGHLQVVRTGESLETKDLVIRDVYRFEGVSDPDDMAIVYGVESASGARGTVVDAFGVYSDPALSAVLRDVPIRPAKRAA